MATGKAKGESLEHGRMAAKSEGKIPAHDQIETAKTTFVEDGSGPRTAAIRSARAVAAKELLRARVPSNVTTITVVRTGVRTGVGKRGPHAASMGFL